jgi:hypothetical protein
VALAALSLLGMLAYEHLGFCRRFAEQGGVEAVIGLLRAVCGAGRSREIQVRY